MIPIGPDMFLISPYQQLSVPTRPIDPSGPLDPYRPLEVLSATLGSNPPRSIQAVLSIPIGPRRSLSYPPLSALIGRIGNSRSLSVPIGPMGSYRSDRSLSAPTCRPLSVLLVTLGPSGSYQPYRFHASWRSSCLPQPLLVPLDGSGNIFFARNSLYSATNAACEEAICARIVLEYFFLSS